MSGNMNAEIKNAFLPFIRCQMYSASMRLQRHTCRDEQDADNIFHFHETSTFNRLKKPGVRPGHSVYRVSAAEIKRKRKSIFIFDVHGVLWLLWFLIWHGLKRLISCQLQCNNVPPHLLYCDDARDSLNASCTKAKCHRMPTSNVVGCARPPMAPPVAIGLTVSTQMSIILKWRNTICTSKSVYLVSRYFFSTFVCFICRISNIYIFFLWGTI